MTASHSFLSRLMLLLILLPAVALLATARAADSPRVIRVSNGDELRAAVRATTPGNRIELAPGDYVGGFYFENLRGEKGKPIVITAADPARPPRFTGGGTGLHLVNPVFVELHHLHFSGLSANGLSLDDGGRHSPVPRDLVLRGLRITDVGPRGNHDGIKLSGLTGFRVEDCVIERWGTGSGSGVDMVGCHDGLFLRNTLRHRAEQPVTGGSGIQAKGGSSNIVIRQNRFEHAGTRAVNIGGSTGMAFFRPPLAEWPEGAGRWEAKNITVEGNTFIGSGAPVAFVGVDGAVVRCNTIYRPARWVLRILQETHAPGFVPCRGGVFSENLVVFHSAGWGEGGVNIGGGTAPETFRFLRNHWFCLDRPELSRPHLPVPEVDGTYGVAPQFEQAEQLDLRQKATSPARGRGAEALTAK